MRGVVPNALTAARIPLGAAAVVAAADGRVERAAALITLGAVTDGLDGWAARRLGHVSAFGALFDYFCDYLCFVVAPWMLTRALLASDHSTVRDVLLILPLLTAAIRYTRNGLIVGFTGEDAPPLPGLGTVFFAFLSVTAVFLDAPQLMDPQLFAWTMTTAVVVVSAMMVSPITYPKLVLCSLLIYAGRLLTKLFPGPVLSRPAFDIASDRSNEAFDPQADCLSPGPSPTKYRYPATTAIARAAPARVSRA